MFRIEPYRRADLPSIVAFVEAIQEIERVDVPDLRPGAEIGSSYAETLLRSVDRQDGVILLAKDGDQAVGFACAWIERDDDPLLLRRCSSARLRLGHFRRRGLASAGGGADLADRHRGRDASARVPAHPNLLEGGQPRRRELPPVCRLSTLRNHLRQGDSLGPAVALAEQLR
jgi:hypothetical protein